MTFHPNQLLVKEPKAEEPEELNEEGFVSKSVAMQIIGMSYDEAALLLLNQAS